MDVLVDTRSDSELLLGSRKDPTAFRVFYRRHSRPVDSWICKQVKNDSTAAELTAETFARAWIGIDSFVPEAPDSGRAWLFGIARNLVRDYFRKQQIDRSACERLGIEQVQTAPDTYELVRERMAGSEIAAQVAQLPAHERAAVELRVFADLSFSDVANKLGCSNVAARIRVSRGLKRIRSEISSGGDGSRDRIDGGLVDDAV